MAPGPVLLRLPAMAASHLCLRFFGGFALEIAEVPAVGVPKPAQELLVQLAIAGPRGVDRIEVASALWPQVTPERARFYLRRCLTQLRSILGNESGRLSSYGERRISLDLSDCFCDLVDFELATGSLAEKALVSAARAYAGDLLPGNHSEWVRPVRESYRDRYVRVLHRLAAADQVKGDFDAALKVLMDAIQAEPCREESYRLLMRILHQKGDYLGVAYAFRELRTSLLNDVGLSPSSETVDLYRELVAEAQTVVQARRDDTSRQAGKMVAFPSPVGGFTGRAAELTELGDRVKDSRMVTVTGLGGVGKSRLAIEAAAALHEQFSGGTAFADMSACKGLDDVVDRIARSLGLQDTDELGALSHGGRVLLCLDGAEHVSAECSQVIGKLLQDAPNVHVLCTSRVALHTPDEHIFRLEPLHVPGRSQTDLTSVLATEAVEFFLASTKRAGCAFITTLDNVDALKELCIRLDGVPLALELAAVRLRSLPIGEIVDNLDDRFHLLDVAGGTHGGRRTLSGVLDWSFHLLTPPEQVLLVRLGVFPSSWSLGAAQAVCADAELASKQIPFLLANLASHSLIVFDPASDGGRYSMLETVRTYVRERFSQSPDLTEGVAFRHAEYFFRAAIAPKVSSEDLPNFSGAVDTFLSSQSPERREMGLVLVNRLFPVWYRAGTVSYALRFALKVVESFGDTRSEAMTEAVFRAAGAAHWLFNIDLANELFARAEEMGDALGLEEWNSEILHARGELAANDGRLEDADRLLRSALARFRLAGDLSRQATCLRMLGYVKRELQDFEEAQELTHDALAIYTKLDHSEGRLWCLGSLAAINLSAHAPERAAPLLLQTLELQQRDGNTPGEAWNLTMLGITYVQLRDYPVAEAFFVQAIALHEREAESLSKAWPMQELGELYRLAGRLNEAREAVSEALRLCRSSGSTNLEARALIRLCAIAVEQKDLASARAYRDTARELLATIQAPQIWDDLEKAAGQLREASEAKSFDAAATSASDA